MANAAGFIQESIWRDEHWRRLSRSAQALYLQLLSQKELDCAGLVPLHPAKWAKGCAGLTASLVLIDLEELQRERFVFFDTDTDEAFIRTYIRNSNVIKSPNMMKSALRSALLVASERIRVELAVELRLTDRADALVVAEKLNPSGTPPEPFGNPSNSNGSERVSKPSGVGVGEGVPHLGSNSRGEEPSKCSLHEENSDEPCHMCRRRREWEKAHEADELEQQRRKRQAAADHTRACTICGGTGQLDVDDNTVRPCECREAEHG